MAFNSMLFAIATLSASVHANMGASRPGGIFTPAAVQVLHAAGRNPNSTNSVDFTRSNNGLQQSWSWRINVTEISVPNNIEQLGNPEADSSLGRSVINTQWQLDWPLLRDGSDGTFEDFLGQTNSTLNAHALRLSSVPSSIANRRSHRSNGDCSALLGNHCAQFLEQGAGLGDGGWFSALSACHSSLPNNNVDNAGFTILPATETHATIAPLHRGETFFFYTSEPSRRGDTKSFNQAESALYILAMDIRSGNPANQTKQENSATVLCQIVGQAQSSTTLDLPVWVSWLLTPSFWGALATNIVATVWLCTYF